MLAPELEPGARVLFNGAAREGTIAINFEAVAKEVGKSAVMANAVAAGAVMELLGYDLAPLFARLEAVFLKKKGPQVVADNIACATRGAELARPQRGESPGPAPVGAPSYAISGSEAIALGIATAGTKFVAAYPMTPSTGIFTQPGRNARAVRDSSRASRGRDRRHQHGNRRHLRRRARRDDDERRRISR